MTQLINKLKKLFSLCNKLSVIAQKYYYHNLIRFKGSHFHGAELWVLGGEESVKNYSFPSASMAEKVWAHAYDYDLYLDHCQGVVVEKNVAVFLDQYLPFHPDFALFYRNEYPVKADSYYPKLVEYFDALEKKLNIRVVIAAHPRAFYTNPIDYFGGRTIVQGNTVELVRESKLVIAHYSTALNFAVLFNKPVSFVTTNTLKKSSFGLCVEAMASCLGKIPLNLDISLNEVDWQEMFRADEQKYKQYKESFIKTSGSSEKPLWQIIADHLKSLPANPSI